MRWRREQGGVIGVSGCHQWRGLSTGAGRAAFEADDVRDGIDERRRDREEGFESRVV
jgi:hypothetical protein